MSSCKTDVEPVAVCKRSRRALCTRAVLSFALLAAACAPATAENWAEKLGYPPGKRVVILHAEGAGLCYESNRAGKESLSRGLVQTAGAMVPCPWFEEFAAWHRKHAEHDVGLVVTLTSPFKHYRWRPLSSRGDSPALYDADGFAWHSALQVALNATPEEVERELRAQIDRARQLGLQPSHLRTYLGTIFFRPDFAAAYLQVSREYWIPASVVELTPEVVNRFRNEGIPLDEDMIDLVANYPLPKIDDLQFAPLAETYEAKRDAFIELIGNLKPGITQIVLHPAAHSEALEHVTSDWQQYVWEAQLLSDATVRNLLASEEFMFTTWKEIMRRFEGAPAADSAKEPDR